MSRNFSFIFLAIAFMAVAACTGKENQPENPQPEDPQPEVVEGDFMYSLPIVETKAVIGSDRVQWESGDEVSVFAGTVPYKGVVSFVDSKPYVNFDSDTEIKDGTIISASYPYVSGASVSEMSISVPPTQYGKTVSSMPLAAAPVALKNKTADLFFLNLGSVIEYRIYSTNSAYCSEKVLSVTLTADQGIVGESKIDLSGLSASDPESLEISGLTQMTATVNEEIAVENNKDDAVGVRMVVAPCDVQSCEIVVATDKANYTFQFSPEHGFVRSMIKTLNIDLKNGVRSSDDDEPSTDPDTPAVEPITASLTYAEFGDDHAKYVAGYGKSKSYTNDSGTWTICAYDSGSYIQINSGKIAYVGTPKFDHNITSITIDVSSTYTDNYYICTDAGSSTAAVGVEKTVKGTLKSTTIDVESLELKQIYIRSSACARITAITVNVGTSGATDPDPGTGEVEEGGDTPSEGGDDPDTPSQPYTSAGGWYELPVVNDADKNGVDDNDNTLYYASHSFSMGGKSYRNYTVCFSSEHHCPVWVAAPRHSVYVGSQNRTNAYKQDPTIQSLASGMQYYSKDTGGGCNKGHMLGSAERTCCADANRQVFYYSNIAPQLSSGFNTGGGGWNILEDYIDTRIPADTLYEVIGCYFEKYTDAYGNTVNPKKIEFGGRSDVGFPTMFYYAVIRTKAGNSKKALKDCTASEIQCVAFVRSHTNSLKGQKPSAKEMMSISDLEKITGFTYFPNVPNAPKSTFKASDWGL